MLDKGNADRNLDTSLSAEMAEQPPVYDNVVKVLGIKTGVGILVTVAGIPIGVAGPDGSEEIEEVNDTNEVATLKDLIRKDTSGNTQKVALYLAEHVGKKFTSAKLTETLEIPNKEMILILMTLSERAHARQWPVTLGYSRNFASGFTARKEA